jgi:hypothetical protein
MKKIIALALTIVSITAFADERTNCYIKAAQNVSDFSITGEGLGHLCSNVVDSASTERVIKCYIDSVKQIQATGIGASATGVGILCSKP